MYVVRLGIEVEYPILCNGRFCWVSYDFEKIFEKKSKSHG